MVVIFLSYFTLLYKREEKDSPGVQATNLCLWVAWEFFPPLHWVGVFFPKRYKRKDT